MNDRMDHARRSVKDWMVFESSSLVHTLTHGFLLLRCLASSSICFQALAVQKNVNMIIRVAENRSPLHCNTHANSLSIRTCIIGGMLAPRISLVSRTMIVSSTIRRANSSTALVLAWLC